MGPSPDRARAGSGAVTGSGAVLGTADYIAPEQADDAHRADIRADIYSLGCTLYFLLAGQPPFPGGTLIEKLSAHSRRSPEPLDTIRTDLPHGLEPVLDRMMAKDPAHRYQTPAEVARALAPFAEGAVASPPSSAKANGPGTGVRWALHARTVVEVAIALTFLNELPGFQTASGMGNPILRRLWLPLLFLVFYLPGRLTLRADRRGDHDRPDVPQSGLRRADRLGGGQPDPQATVDCPCCSCCSTCWAG